MKIAPKPNAFSLVEVVLALGVFVFAGFALIGLLGIGLQNSQDSRERIQAATIAEALCTTRRVAPTNDFTVSQPLFPLPTLNQPGNINNLTSPIYLTRDGTTTTAAKASFGFLYNIYGSSASPGVATAYLCLYWPPQASPTSAATSHFELTTTFALP